MIEVFNRDVRFGANYHISSRRLLQVNQINKKLTCLKRLVILIKFKLISHFSIQNLLMQETLEQKMKAMCQH